MNDSPQSTVHSPRSSCRPQAACFRPKKEACGLRLAAWSLSYGLWTMVYGLLLTGCVTRSLTIKTEPPGALVYVNDELKGDSPVTYDFVWYGWHRVTLRKEGYQRLDDHRLLRSPAYLWIPFDMVFELMPFPFKDARTWSYTLMPAPALPTPAPPAPSTQQVVPKSTTEHSDGAR